MTLYIIFFCFVCVALLWVTIRQKDAFPFSNYPMFSTPALMEQVAVYRLALEYEDGRIEWWRPKMDRYAEIAGKKIGEICKQGDASVKEIAAKLFQKNKLLQEVLRIILLENENNDRCISILVVERTVNDKLVIADKTIDKIAVSKLYNGKLH